MQKTIRIFSNGNDRLYKFSIKEKARIKVTPTILEFNLGSIKSIYRNLRENYEYRLRYDEAGQFFIREMELKRRYRETTSYEILKIKENGFFRQHFSLTGLYYHLSRYGEDLFRPTVVGIAISVLSSLFWLMQSNPTLAANVFCNCPYTIF